MMWKLVKCLLTCFWILALANYTDTSKVHRRHAYKRSSGLPQTMSVQSLLNVSRTANLMTCVDALTMPSIRTVHLDDDQLRYMFEGKGGNYVHDYLAATQEEALENFPNMLMLPMPANLGDGNDTFNMYDNYLAKQVIMEDLHKLSLYLLNVSFSTTRNPQTATTGPGSRSSPAPVQSVTSSAATPSTSSTLSKPTTSHYYSRFSISQAMIDNDTNIKTSNATKDKSTTTTITKELSATTAADLNYINTTTKGSNLYTAITDTFIENDKITSKTTSKTTNQIDTTATSSSYMYITHSLTSESVSTTTQPTKETTKEATSAQKTNTTTQPTKETTKEPTSAHETTTIDPDVLNSLNQLHQYLQGGGINASELTRIGREANTTLHPATLLALTVGHTRKKRNADGSFSEEQYCQMKGSPTDDGKFVHMCSMCAATTKLPDDFFPRYINEVVCKKGDSDCFTVAGTAHGQCKQRTIALNLMQRKSGKCLVMDHNGDTLVMDDWQLAPKVLRVSCECTLNKLSVFSQYIAQHVPVG